MKIAGISNYILNNRLAYKGHGQIEHASSNASVGHVMSHELRHLREFENKARAEGKEIRNKQIHVDFEFRNGRLVAVSGKATALLVDKKDKGGGILEKEEPFTTSKDRPTNIPENHVDTKGSVKIDAPEVNKRQKISQLMTAKIKIDNRLQAIEREQKEVEENKQDREEGTVAGPEFLRKAHLKQKEYILKLKEQRVESSLQKLEAQRLAELQQDMLKGIIQSQRAAAGLLQTIYGAGSPEGSTQNGILENLPTISSHNSNSINTLPPGLALDIII